MVNQTATERLTITIPEFARYAGISKNQAYFLASTDSLGVPVIRFGRRMVLPHKAALALLESGGRPEDEIGNEAVK